MKKDVVTLSTISNMESCKKALQSPHNAFPVVNTAGRLVGLIPKSMVVVILEKKAFYDRDSTDCSDIMPEVANIIQEEVTRPVSLNNDNSREPLIQNQSREEDPGHAAQWDLDYDS